MAPGCLFYLGEVHPLPPLPVIPSLPFRALFLSRSTPANPSKGSQILLEGLGRAVSPPYTSGVRVDYRPKMYFCMFTLHPLKGSLLSSDNSFTTMVNSIYYKSLLKVKGARALAIRHNT